MKAGNYAEAQRLATQAQMATQTQALQKEAMGQAWEVSKAALPDLAAASYWTKITVSQAPCFRCNVPDVSGGAGGASR